MKNTFAILAGFLDRADSEVEGRSAEPPPEAMKQRLQEFARGTLPEAEVGILVEQLNQNKNWMSFLAEEAKALRTKPPRNQ